MILDREDDIKIEKIIKNSFNKFLLDNNNKYVPCLTTDCDHYFEKIEKEVLCPLCLQHYCLICKDIYHNNTTCQ